MNKEKKDGENFWLYDSVNEDEKVFSPQTSI